MNAQTFAEQYDATYDKIFLYILRRCSQIDLAQDLTSETYFKALKNLAQYQKQTNTPFIAWLYRIASNEINMYFRKAKRYQFAELKEHPELIQTHRTVSPTIQFEQREHYQVIQRALTQLKPVDQTIVSLRYFEEKTIPEISEIVEDTELAVRSRLCRALKKLRTILQQQGQTNII